jgi:ABC-type proline/glycine betaine transport system permease subunit
MNDPLIPYLGLGLICMLVVVLHQRRHGRSSVVWSVVALLFTFPGLVLYFMFGPFGSMTAAQKGKVQQAAERLRTSGYTVTERRTPTVDGLVLCHDGEEYEIVLDKAGKMHFKLVTPWPYTLRYLLGGAVVFIVLSLFSEVWVLLPGLLVLVGLTGVAEKVYRAARKRSIEQVYAEMGKVFVKVV